MESLDTLLSRELRLWSPADTANLWSRTNRLKELTQVLDEIETWPGLLIQPDRYGLQFVAGDAALGCLRWDGRLEATFPAEIRDRFLAEEMATAGPDQSGSDRVVWIVRKPADVDRAVWLLRLSYLRFFGDLNTFQTGEAHYEEQR